MPENKSKVKTQKTKVTTEKVAKKPTKASVEATVKIAASTKQTGLTVDVFDVKGKTSTIALPKEIFDTEVNEKLMVQAVHVYLNNQRAGTVKTQTRGEVTGSTRKIYRQKGTGRARHGGVRAPIFVKGGVAHGPKPKDYALSMPKKMKKIALFSALTTKRKEGGIKVINGLETIAPKTKEMVAIVKKMALDGKKNTVLLVTTGQKDKITNILKAARNIENVIMTPATGLNTYDVLRSNTVLFMKDAIDGMQKGETK